MPPPVRSLLDGLAELVEYPRGPLDAAARRCLALAGPSDGDAASAIERFAREVEGKTEAQLQEAYTHVFDLCPSCSLDTGWHLFGDTPDRAAFLVAMRDALARVGVPEGGELPDHLPRVLQLLGREEPDRAGVLARLVVPAVASVRRGLAGRASLYADLLAAIELVVANVGAPRAVETATP